MGVACNAAARANVVGDLQLGYNIHSFSAGLRDLVLLLTALARASAAFCKHQNSQSHQTFGSADRFELQFAFGSAMCVVAMGVEKKTCSNGMKQMVLCCCNHMADCCCC